MVLDQVRHLPLSSRLRYRVAEWFENFNSSFDSKDDMLLQLIQAFSAEIVCLKSHTQGLV